MAEQTKQSGITLELVHGDEVSKLNSGLTLELDHGDEVGVRRHRINTLPLTQIPDHGTVVLTPSGHMEAKHTQN